MEAFAVPFLLVVGGLLAVQAAANVQLSAAVGSPTGGATVQLAIGALLLTMAAATASALAALGLVAHAPPWHLVGGVGSAVYITGGILLFPRLGAVVTVGLFIAGQMLASLLLDTTGWLGVDPRPADAEALLGIVAVLVGAAAIVRAQARAPARARRAPRVPFGVFAGAVLPVQGAVNVQLRADLDAPFAAAMWSFAVAAAAMAAVYAGLMAARRAPAPRVHALRRVPWWGWLGGLCGAIYVTSIFLLIPHIGVAPTVGLTVAGQQLASVFVDRHGWLRLPRRPIAPGRLAGVAIVLAGVALIQIA
jgi:transporter family-2 protein